MQGRAEKGASPGCVNDQGTMLGTWGSVLRETRQRGCRPCLGVAPPGGEGAATFTCRLHGLKSAPRAVTPPNFPPAQHTS